MSNVAILMHSCKVKTRVSLRGKALIPPITASTQPQRKFSFLYYFFTQRKSAEKAKAEEFGNVLNVKIIFPYPSAINCSLRDCK